MQGCLGGKNENECLKKISQEIETGERIGEVKKGYLEYLGDLIKRD